MGVQKQRPITYLVALLAEVALSSNNEIHPVRKKGEFELLILHSNDMHARFEQTNKYTGSCSLGDRDAGRCYGGFPRIAHVVKEARRAAATGTGPPVLFLNAGDTFTGTAWFSIYKWKVAAEFLNALQPDAVSLGNHEFDHGISGLTPFIRSLKCPVITCNLNVTNEPALAAEENLMNSVIFNVNGTQVRVIGYLTPETKFLALHNRVDYIEEVKAIRKEMDRMKNENVKIYIVLGHSGLAKDIEIAREVEGVDLVVGGHSHTMLWNGTIPDVDKPEGLYPTVVKQKHGRSVPIVQAFAFTKYIGRIHLKFNSEGELISYNGNPILLDYHIPQDAGVLDMVTRYRADIIKTSEVVVGNTSVFLDGYSCRLNECNMGNMITDAMIEHYASKYVGPGWTDAPTAIIQGGGIRSSIVFMNQITNITKGDLFTVLPFGGKTTKITTSGSVILKALEYSISRYNPASSPGAFLQVSGLKVKFNLNFALGSRVRSVLIQSGTVAEYFKLRDNKMYNILLPSYIASGGDGFKMLVGQTNTEMDYDELQSVTEYISKHSPVNPTVEGRILVVQNVRADEPLTANSTSMPKLSLSLLLALSMLSRILFCFLTIKL